MATFLLTLANEQKSNGAKQDETKRSPLEVDHLDTGGNKGGKKRKQTKLA